MPANPHEIKKNGETSFVVQTQGVQIAKDASDGGANRYKCELFVVGSVWGMVIVFE